MTTTSDILGRPQRIRKLEFLMRYYTDEQERQNQIDDKMRYDNLMKSLQNEYHFLTGSYYQCPQTKPRCDKEDKAKVDASILHGGKPVDTYTQEARE